MTPAEINALPERVRKYIMGLSTDADPAGTIADNFRLTEENAALRKLLATPGAEWRERGEPDPHGQHYNCERAQLCMGDLTDDELANAVYMHGDSTPKWDAIRAGKAMLPIAYLQAAKDRIRWLSRALDFELKKDRS